MERKKIIIDTWEADDIIGHFDLKDETITEEEAEQILWRMEKDYDANLGYQWDVVDIAWNNIKSERKIDG